MSSGNRPGQSFFSNESAELPRLGHHKLLGFWYPPSSLATRQQNSLPRISRVEFPNLYSAYIRQLLECGGQIVHWILMQLAAPRTGAKSCQGNSTRSIPSPYPFRLNTLYLYPLDLRRIGGDLFLLFSLFASCPVGEFFILSPPSFRGH